MIDHLLDFSSKVPSGWRKFTSASNSFQILCQNAKTESSQIQVQKLLHTQRI